MKPQNRIRRNDNAAAAARQGKISPQNAILVRFISAATGRQICRAFFRKKELATIESYAKKLNVSLGKLIELAIVNKLGKGEEVAS